MLEQIAASLQEWWAGVSAFIVALVPRLVVALVIAALGWVIASVVRVATRRVIALIAQRTGGRPGRLGEALRLAELPAAPVLLPALAFWIAWIVLLASAIDALQVPGFHDLRTSLLQLLARLARALAIVVLGLFGSNIVWRATLLAAFNAGVRSARLIAGTLYLLLIALTVLTGLAHVGIPLTIVLTAFSIAFGAVMLGLALAFGLGGRDMAAEILRQQSIPGRPPEDGSTHL